MAKIVKYQEIPLDDLTIGRGQARVQDIGKEIEDLAESIKVQGLLQPIVVCPAREAGKWEILTGQRRFLAHRILRRESIAAAVLDERVEEHEAKAISITENLIRRKLSGKELIDGVTYLYKIYGTAKAVTETTGLSYKNVLNYVKYPRLASNLKEMVDENQIDVNVALKAQDAATKDDGETDIDVATKLAQEMEQMTGVQRTKFSEEFKKNPAKPIDDKIEDAKTGARVTQIWVTVTHDTHDAIQRFAQEEGTNQNEATAVLIEEALIGRGLLEEE